MRIMESLTCSCNTEPCEQQQDQCSPTGCACGEYPCLDHSCLPKCAIGKLAKNTLKLKIKIAKFSKKSSNT